jgi:hypothetical protein
MGTSFRNKGFADPFGFDSEKVDVEQEEKKIDPETGEELDPHEEVFDIEDLLNFDPTNDPNKLLGSRWLGLGDTFFFAGDSGKGKSSFTIKLGVEWALNKSPLGIGQTKPLKTLIVQAENNFGDMSEMLQGVLGTLDESSRAIVKKRVIIRRMNAKTGQEFVDYIDKKLETIKPDVVICDPFVSYFDGEQNSTKETADFLRRKLDPVIRKHNALFGFAHHVRKPERRGTGNKGEKTDADLILTMHDIPGSAEVSRWAREIIMLSELNEDKDGRKFNLGFWKRASRTGVANNITLRHAKGRIDWDIDSRFSGKATGPSQTEKHAKMEAGMRELLEQEGLLGKSTVMNHAKKKGWNKSDAWDFIHSLVDGVNYHFVELFGHPHVSKDPNPIKVDPDADKKKVLWFVTQNRIVSKNMLDQWAEGDPSAPSGDKALKLADVLAEEGLIEYTEKFRFPHHPRESKVYSIGNPHNYRWIDKKPVAEEEYQKHEQNPNAAEGDPFA